MSGHVIGPFGIVAPSGVLRRQPAERRCQIRKHRRIGVLLDREGRRGVTDEERHHALDCTGVPHKPRDLVGQIDEAASGSLNREQ
jgi:hypothetical protein